MGAEEGSDGPAEELGGQQGRGAGVEEGVRGWGVRRRGGRREGGQGRGEQGRGVRSWGG